MEAPCNGLLISPVSAREDVGKKISFGTLQYPLARCIACIEGTRFLIDLVTYFELSGKKSSTSFAGSGDETGSEVGTSFCTFQDSR